MDGTCSWKVGHPEASRCDIFERKFTSRSKLSLEGIAVPWLTAPGSPRMLKLKGWPEMRVIFLLQLNRPGLSWGREMTGISGYIKNSLHLAREYARIFVLGHYLFLEALWASRNRYFIYIDIIFAPNGGYFLLISSFKSFSQRAQFWKLKFSDIPQFQHSRPQSLRSFSGDGRGKFDHVMYLDQWHASENISWIIIRNVSSAPNDIDNYTNFAIEK